MAHAWTCQTGRKKYFFPGFLMGCGDETITFKSDWLNFGFSLGILFASFYHLSVFVFSFNYPNLGTWSPFPPELVQQRPNWIVEKGKKKDSVQYSMLNTEYVPNMAVYWIQEYAKYYYILNCITKPE